MPINDAPRTLGLLLRTAGGSGACARFSHPSSSTQSIDSKYFSSFAAC
jgi:hypothetical protein